MKSNAEIRREAKSVLAYGWYGRIACVFITLYLIMLLAVSSVGAVFAAMNIQTISDHILAKMQAAQQGLAYAIPSLTAGLSMTGASVFVQMIGYLFSAIFLFGLATVLLKSIKNDSNRWFAESFGGFARPFEVFWLILLINVKVFLWSLLFVIPGIVAMYRYRQAWYLKSENPEWGAFKCLSESGKMMKGHKWEAFCLDFWFVLWFVLYMIAFAVLGSIGGILAQFVGGVISAAGGMFVMALFVWLIFRLAIYFFAARAVFYKAVVEAKAAECPAES